MTYNNPWRALPGNWKDSPPHLTGIDYEYRVKHTLEVKSLISLPGQHGKRFVWEYDEEWDPLVTYPSDDIEWRYNDKQYQKAMKAAELVRAGDFVKFKNSKRTYKYRKVLEIKEDSIFGQCASKPNEESLVLHSSENSLYTIQEIYRNGEKLFP